VGSICISGDDAGAGGVPEVGHAAGESSWFLSYLIWERRLVELEMNNKNLSTYIWWSIAFAFVIGYAINFTKGLSGFDWFHFYYPQARYVSAERLINPLWVYFVLGPISRLPLLVSYILFLVLNVVMLWIGSQLAGGQRFLLLFSFPAFWVLWFGQLDGFVLLGTALGLKALDSEDPISMGLAILLLLVKPHIGGPLAVLYLLWSRKRETILVIIGIVLLSMAVWGWDWLALWGNLEDFRWICMVSYHLPLDHGEFDVVSFLEIGAS
jgi:hypothetical protein